MNRAPLNEAFWNIMGAAIEFYYQPTGSGRDQADRPIAEDANHAPPGYLRSLSNPNSKGHPDHYSFAQSGDRYNDGGVHFNMTIGTHAFYLAVAGGRNRVSGISVPGIGMANIERMERVFYRAFTQLMDQTRSSHTQGARRCRRLRITAAAATNGRRWSSPGPPWGSTECVQRSSAFVPSHSQLSVSRAPRSG